MAALRVGGGGGCRCRSRGLQFHDGGLGIQAAEWDYSTF